MKGISTSGGKSNSENTSFNNKAVDKFIDSVYAQY
jgi:hypothetical protein